MPCLPIFRELFSLTFIFWTNHACSANLCRSQTFIFWTNHAGSANLCRKLQPSSCNPAAATRKPYAVLKSPVLRPNGCNQGAATRQLQPGSCNPAAATRKPSAVLKSSVLRPNGCNPARGRSKRAVSKPCRPSWTGRPADARNEQFRSQAPFEAYWNLLKMSAGKRFGCDRHHLKHTGTCSKRLQADVLDATGTI